MALPRPPVQATMVYYRNLFGDAGKNVFNGDYMKNILLPYSIPAIGTMSSADVHTLAFNCHT